MYVIYRNQEIELDIQQVNDIINVNLGVHNSIWYNKK